MKRQFGLLAILLLTVASIAFLSSGRAVAASAQVLTVSPAAVNTVLQPNSINTGSFEVINQGSASYTFEVYGAPYHVSGEAYEPGFSYLPGAPNVVSWFHFSTTSVSIKPTQTASIGYTVTVPPGTPAGGYYAVAFAQTQSPKSANSVTINERAGVIFYIRIAGPVVEKGQLLSWQSKFFQVPPLSASIKLNNTGNVHYFSNINLKIKDIFGGVKYSINTQKALLPQTVRLVPLTWPHTPALGLFKISGTATIFNQTKSLPTRYVLVMSHPIQIVCLVIIVLIIVGLISRLLIRRRRPKKPTS